MKKNGKTILVVDDSSLIVERLSDMLNELRHVKQVLAASDYREAHKLLAEEAIDVALLDINLPGKNGIELLKMIVKQHPGIRVVMISNAADDMYRKLCKKEGASYFIDNRRNLSVYRK